MVFKPHFRLAGVEELQPLMYYLWILLVKVSALEFGFIREIFAPSLLFEYSIP